ncbi:MAG: hypothetical protein WC389_11340 [Lutibacter sp.]|jgi:hypothetical protein
MKNTLLIVLLFTSGLFAQNNTNTNSEYSDWLTFKNPYEALQIRYKLEKKEGNVGYYRAQLRINYEEPTRCTDARCLGYALCFGLPQLNDKDVVYLHYKIYYSYKDIYTIPDLIPMKLSFPDGSKRMLKKDGFYFAVNDNSEPVDLQYFFIKSADLILEGSPLRFGDFIESEAITLQ